MTDIAALGFKVDTKGLAKGERALDDLEKSGTRAEKGSKRLSKAYIAAGAAIGAALLKSAQIAIKFETAMAEVSTLVDTSTVSMDGLAESVKGVNAEFGGGLEVQAKALYGIISSGAEAGAEATNLLAVANKLALGGVTDVATAADGLTTVMNAYGEEAETASEISDTFFVAMALGKTTIGELSASIGKAAPLAATLGVSFDELAIAAATLTTGGLSTAEAMTSVNGILKAVLKPTKEAAELAESLGLEFNSAALKADGLAGFLQKVKVATKGSDVEIAQLFGDIEGLKGALALTGSQLKTFEDGLVAVGEKAGATNTAVEKMKDTFSSQWDEFAGKIENIGAAIGEFILPALTSIVRRLNETIEGANLLWDAITGTDNYGAFADLEIELIDVNTQLLAFSMANALATDKAKELAQRSIALSAEAAKLHKTMGVSAVVISDVADEVSDVADEASSAEAPLKKLVKASVDVASGFSKADKEMESYINGLVSVQDEAGNTQRKFTVLFRLFKEQALGKTQAENLKVYNQAVLDLYPDIEKLGEATTDLGESINEDLSSGMADAVLAGDDFGDSLNSLWKRMAADWANAGLSKLFSSLFSGGGFDTSGFSLGGLKESIAGVGTAAASAAGGIGSFVTGLGGATTGAAALAAETGVVVTGMGAMAPAVESAAIQTTQLTTASTGASIGLSALATGAGVLAIGYGIMSASAKRSADLTAEVTAKLQEADITVQNASVTFGQFGEEGVAQLNKAKEHTDVLRHAMVELGVELKGSADGALLITDGFDAAQKAASAFTDSAQADLQKLVEKEMEVVDGQYDYALSASEASAKVGKAWGANIAMLDDTGHSIDDLTGAMVSGVNEMQASIDSLSGVDITSTHTLINYDIYRGDGGGGKALGTGGKFETVPSGYPNDSYPIFLQSGEDYMVRTPADRAAAKSGQSESISVDGGGDNQVVVRLDTLIAQNAKIQARLSGVENAVYLTGTDTVNVLDDQLRDAQANR